MATLKRKDPGFVDASDATPTGRSVKRMRLTRGQKQALIDNLQLESAWEPSRRRNHRANSSTVTERARKLRSQYALQASDLRTRIERRVNRIPISLRKANMGELLEKYTAQTQSTSPLRRPSPAKAARPAANISIDQVISPTRDGRTRRTRQDSYPQLIEKFC